MALVCYWILWALKAILYTVKFTRIPKRYLRFWYYDCKLGFCFTDFLLPVLDVTRLAVRNAAINSDLCSGDMGDQLIGHLQHFLLSDSVTVNQMLSIRILCNMLSHPEGEALALRHKDFLLSVLFELTPPFSKQMQVNICDKWQLL